jgi:hypothetical protein
MRGHPEAVAAAVATCRDRVLEIRRQPFRSPDLQREGQLLTHVPPCTDPPGLSGLQRGTGGCSKDPGQES